MGTPRQATMIAFDCGHKVLLPHVTDQQQSVTTVKYWTDQSVPSVPGGVAACPGCITSRRPRGEIRGVERVSTPEVAGYDHGEATQAQPRE